MVENLKRAREPLGWLVLAVMVGTMALSIVQNTLEVQGTSDPQRIFDAFQSVAANGMSLTLVVVLLAIVALCLFVDPPTRRARGLTLTALIVVGLGTVLTVVATVFGAMAAAGLVGAVFEVLGGLLDVALKIGAVVVLWLLYRASANGRLVTPEPEPAPAPVNSLETDAPPVWQPSQAAGSVWATASAAAAGGEPAASALPAGGPRAALPAATGATAAPDAPAPDAAPATASAWGTPQADPAPNAWGAPQARPGAAEAIGWRRVQKAPDAASTPDASASSDTP